MRLSKMTKRFRREYTKMKRSGKNMQKIYAIMQQLIDGQELPARHRDHALLGKWQHLRDCHIEGDWLLLYEIGKDDQGNDTITFHATGTHAQLFG